MIAGSDGRTLKTVVRGGYADEYVDIYYPDGSLHSHTPLNKGLPQGWSEGTMESGLRTRIYYEQGRIRAWQRLTPQGELIDKGTLP